MGARMRRRAASSCCHKGGAAARLASGREKPSTASPELRSLRRGSRLVRASITTRCVTDRLFSMHANTQTPPVRTPLTHFSLESPGLSPPLHALPLKALAMMASAPSAEARGELLGHGP